MVFTQSSRLDLAAANAKCAVDNNCSETRNRTLNSWSAITLPVRTQGSQSRALPETLGGPPPSVSSIPPLVPKQWLLVDLVDWVAAKAKPAIDKVLQRGTEPDIERLACEHITPFILSATVKQPPHRHWQQTSSYITSRAVDSTRRT